MKIPRSLQHTGLVLGSVILSLLLIEGLSFLFLKNRGPSPQTEFPRDGEIWNFDDARKFSASPDRRGDLSRIILSGNFETQTIKTPAPTEEDFRFHKEAPSYPLSDKGHSLWTGRHGVTPNLDENFELIGSVTGKRKYRAHYTTDPFGRRKAWPEGKKNILFLGCSFTFGQGVNDEESFPFLVGKKSGWRTYNAGIPGASPSSILVRVFDQGFPGPLTTDETTVVFSLIPDHILRNVGTMSFFRANPTALSYFPYAYMDGETLKMLPSFGDDPTRVKPLLNFLANTNFTQAFNLDYPVLGKSEYVLIARVLQAIESNLKKRYPQIKNFVVAFFPTGHLRTQYRELRDVLQEENIRVFDYTFVNGPALLRNAFHLKYDGHPSPLGHDFYSELLIYDLRKLMTPGAESDSSRLGKTPPRPRL